MADNLDLPPASISFLSADNTISLIWYQFFIGLPNKLDTIINDDKETNVSTALSLGTPTATTVPINSDGSSPDITLIEATTSTAGLLGSVKWDEIAANTAARHTETHTVVSHSDTTATGSELDTLTDNSLADTLHRHSELVASDGSPDPAISVDATGNVGIGASVPTELLDINSDAIRIRTAQTPASASATGTTGTICWDTSYFYVCTATDTWQRAAITTW